MKKSSVIILILSSLFHSCSPQFGGVATKEQRTEYEKSSNYSDGKFINQKKVDESLSFKELRKGLWEYLFTPSEAKPQNDILVEKIDSLNIAQFKDSTRLIWFGHSTFLLQLENQNILIDPMFSKVAAPYTWLGSNRFSKELPIEIEKMPSIDAVILSHDHYDHLDYKSILKLKNKVKMFYAPLGVGVHLVKWGIEKERIVELDWWQEISSKGLTFKCTPSQHFSGRKFKTRGSTLWSSWIIQSPTENIFFSGDGGYGDHFKEIGERYGPFDFAMMECGQYDEKWSNIHMFPEQTAQAALDIRAKHMMPIHWGAIKLAPHSWSEPVERVIAAAKKLNLPVIIPRIGEPITLQKTIDYSQDAWWLKY